MNTGDRSRSTDRWSWRLAEVAVAVASAATLLSLTNVSRSLLSAIVIPALAVSLLAIVAARRLLATTTANVTIPLGGSPGVGKTVFANVLSGRLMEGQSRDLSFVPEAQTAQHVYQVLRRLRHDEWPKQTGMDAIDRYRGVLGLRRGGLAATMLHGRLVFQLELGDAAGEHWDELAEESVGEGLGRRDPRKAPRSPRDARVNDTRLIESTFFDYVAKADALFYFIDCPSLRDPLRVADEVDDLLSTLQLLRVVEGVGPSGRLRRPVALILSKADLLTFNEAELLLPLLEPAQAPTASRQADPSDQGLALFDRSVDHLAYALTVVRGQTRASRTFLVSALEAQATDGAPTPTRGSYRTASPWASPVEASVEWVFRELWDSQQFRGVRGWA